MSIEAKNSIHIDCANVNKKNGENSTISCDSGFETSDTASSVITTSIDSDESPAKSRVNNKSGLILNVEKSAVENEGSSEISTPSSLSSDDKADPNILTFDTDSCSDDQNHYDCPALENIAETSLKTAITGIIENEAVGEESEIIDSLKHTNSLEKRNLKGESYLTTSTLSLNESNDKVNSSINVTPHSHSEENINHNKLHEKDLNLTKDLDQERILSEYLSQKNKVSSTQRILPENQVLDVRYARIPKEILSQDIGSIVKNVHGIFSSVSGSLKNAYNNSHRVTPKPQVKYSKPVATGKIMNEIFEYTPNDKQNETKLMENPNNDTIPKLNEESDHEGHDNNEMLKLQIESLERVLLEQRKENVSLKEQVKRQCDEVQAKDQTFKELEAKVDLMCKRAEQVQKEKDAAVMRYASTECAAIEAKRAAEAASKAERAAVAEMELMNAKLRTAREEKQRICQLYDVKCHELQSSEREVAKVREEFRELEGRLKWTQSKLRVEMDAYKESAEKVEKLTQQLTELEASKEAAILNATDTIRARQLETELKESQAALIMCRHEKDEFEKRLSSALQQLEVCRKERDDASSSLTLANEQIEKLKQSNLRLEEEAAELAALRAQAALADTLSAQLDRESERACSLERALSSERARADTCSRREAAALQHAASLTAAHVHERARAAEHDAKAQALAADNKSLRETIQSLHEDAAKLRSALEEQTDRRNKENRVLARKVAEITEEAAELNKKLEYEQGENNVLKKKHASSIKELNRELQRALKRIEILEAKLPQTESNSTRTGSISSLSSTDSPQEERIQNGHTDVLPDVQAREPDRQALVERIVSLQRAAAARSERCEFLQEHCAQLTAELRRKARLLRALLPELPRHALVTHTADRHKSEIAQLGGGAMAAVWGGDPGGMSHELSIEMNKRLQAVLEDTLLKNITLKENMDTLGEEISRLREQIQQNDK